MIDLTQQPYREYVELLQEMRRDPAAREWAAFDRAHEDGRGTYDRNEQERARLTYVLQVTPVSQDAAEPAADHPGARAAGPHAAEPAADHHGARAAGPHLELVRYLLDQEIEARHNDSFQGAGDVLMMLSIRLLELSDGDADDVWRFWSAKYANFDTAAGGYDITFAFAQHPADEIRRIVEERGDERDLRLFDKCDLDAIAEYLPTWRAKLAKRYPASVDDFTHADAADYAELFGDMEAYEHHSLQLAETPQDRAYLCRRLKRWAEAVDHWRDVAAAATTDWDRASAQQRAISDAAKASLPLLDEVAQLDALRANLPEWNRVGLGRMATQSCFELAAAVTDEGAGRTLFDTAQRWHRDLDSFMLVGLEAGVAAAEKWGTAEELADLKGAAEDERQRIAEMLA